MTFQKRTCVEIGMNIDNSNWDGARFERYNIWGKLKEMQLTIQKKGKN